MKYGSRRLSAAGITLAAAMTLLAPAGAALAQSEAPAKAPAAKELRVGDAAPALKIEKWIKGEEIKSFEKGKVYLVEFWATWCGPCKKSIPHLTEIQKQYKDKGVRIVGVSIWEEAGALDRDVIPFVTKMGEKMDYTVGYGGDEAEMAKTWMEAAGRNGIPSSFIVNQEGKVAWIGHPMQKMDEVLGAVVAGTYDMKSAVDSAGKAADAEKKARQLQTKLQAAYEAENHSEFVKLADEMIALQPESAAGLTLVRFKVTIVNLKDAPGAYAFARQVSKGAIKDHAMALNQIAWTILDEPGIEPRDFDVAMEIAVRASEVSEHKDAAIEDTLARAHFEKGDIDKAIEIQKKAVAMADIPDLKDQLEEALAKYEKAKADQKH